ncbi:MAG: ATP-binding protein [bacterium]
MDNGKQPNILVIDDEKGLREGTKRFLENEGFFVDTAENGTIGIEKGTTRDFDMALIDLKMPDIDGLSVLQEIKKNHPKTVCLIATAYASYDTAIEATKIGAYSYIPKPFTPDELLYELNKAFQQRKLIDEAEQLRLEREEKLLALANEKSRLHTIINTIQDGVVVINKLGEVVYFNNAAIKYLDLSYILIGEYILELIPHAISDMVNKFLKSENIIQKTISKQLDIKPNHEMVVEVSCTPVPHTDGKLAAVVLVIKNITELKKIELIKSQFVSMVAHELKTPVAAVQGFLKILLDENIQVTADQEHDYLKRSVVRLSSLLALVNDLLDISRMELKTKDRELIEFDIKEVIESTIQLLEMELKKKEIIVEKDYQTDFTKIKADINEVTRVATNLLSNAIKYNRQKGKIKIELSESKNYLVIKVADSGIGLKPEESEKLFQEFYRAKNQFTKGISGTGLGLTIVKRIIDLYHGKITVESEYGVGTTFIIQLPINK